MFHVHVQDFCTYISASVDMPDNPLTVGDPPVESHVTFKIALMLHSTSTDILLSHLFVKPPQFLLLFALSYNEYDISRVFFDNVELDVSVKMLVKTIDL